MRDGDFDGEVDSGIRTSNLGSSFPEGTYRPVPIVWFAAAYIGQSFLLVVLFSILMNKPGYFLIAASAIVTFWIGRMTFARGMAQAASGWRIATVAMLLLNLGFVSLGALGQGS